MDRANIKIEPMQVFFGDNIFQVDQVTIPADSAGSMDNKYFFLYSASGKKYHVWFNINSAGTDPAPAGSTGIEVDGATAATGATLAGSAATAIAAVTETMVSQFSAANVGAVLTITRAVAGYCLPCRKGVGTFTCALVTEGDSSLDVGFTDGNIEVTIGEESEIIESHQTGKTKLGKIQTGFNMKVKLNLKETSALQIRKILSKPGDVFTPSADGSTELMGAGSSKQFLANTPRQRGLRLHPVTLGASDHTRDVNFWKADPNLSNLTFSGDKNLMIPVDFDVYQDSTKPAQINLFAIGDATQTLS